MSMEKSSQGKWDPENKRKVYFSNNYSVLEPDGRLRPEYEENMRK